MRPMLPPILILLSLAAGCGTHPPAELVGGGEAGTIVLTAKDTGRSIRIPVPAQNGKPTDVKGVDELIRVFDDMCLQSFPDDGAVAAKAQAAGYAPLTDAQLKVFLHSDPGRGWDVRVKDEVMALTIELPPFHSCAVRTMLPADPDVGYATAIPLGLWGASRSPVETVLVLPFKTITTNGPVQDEQGYILVGPDKKEIETFGAYITHFPNSPRVELRLVRMRGDNPR